MRKHGIRDQIFDHGLFPECQTDMFFLVYFRCTNAQMQYFLVFLGGPDGSLDVERGQGGPGTSKTRVFFK